MDEDELPEFEPGAFCVLAPVDETKLAVSPEFLDEYLPEGVILRHTMRELIGSMELVRESELNCSQGIEMLSLDSFKTGAILLMDGPLPNPYDINWELEVVMATHITVLYETLMMHAQGCLAWSQLQTE